MDISQTDNGTGYQSGAFQDDLHNVEFQESQTPTPYQPQVQGFGGSQSYTALEEELPESMNNLGVLDVFIPRLTRYVGTNIIQFVYLIFFILGIFHSIYMVLQMIVRAFQIHILLGFASIPFSIVLGVIGCVITLFVLRIVVELILSVFVIRERLTRIVALKELKEKKN